jgi:tetratricopeptide (TPR) repeat protein
MADDAKVGEKFLANTNLQLATAYLVQGKIAAARSEPSAARSAWEAALLRHPHDCEAARYLGELDLAAGDIDSALEHFSKAYALAPDDKLLSAETRSAVATFYKEQGRPRWELAALIECAADFADAGANHLAAAAYARAGEIAIDLGQNQQGPRLLRKAFENYQLAGDFVGMRQMRDHLENLGEDVSELPTVDHDPVRRRIPWFWIRLGMEVAVLGAAAYLFFIVR